LVQTVQVNVGQRRERNPGIALRYIPGSFVGGRLPTFSALMR